MHYIISTIQNIDKRLTEQVEFFFNKKCEIVTLSLKLKLVRACGPIKRTYMLSCIFCTVISLLVFTLKKMEKIENIRSPMGFDQSRNHE